MKDKVNEKDCCQCVGLLFLQNLFISILSKKTLKEQNVVSTNFFVVRAFCFAHMVLLPKKSLLWNSDA
jgi:hypothetical protein